MNHLQCDRRGFFSFLLPALALAPRAFGQNSAEMAARFRKMSEQYEHDGLAQPFKGITTNGEVVPGLFPIHSSGVSTHGVRNAAENFIATLSNPQRAKTLFAIDDPEWRKWMNQHFYVRQGISFQDMSETQRDAAFSAASTSLSLAASPHARHHAPK